MQQMYPHPIDRYRIGAILLKDAIEKRGGVTKIEQVALRSRGTIYNLKKDSWLTKRAFSKQDAATRESLLETLGGRGLQMSSEDINVLLWLYVWKKKAFNKDGGFLSISEHECDSYDVRLCRGLETDIDAQTLRDHALQLLQEACNRWIDAKPRERTVKMVKMMLVLTEEHRLQSSRELLAFEKETGQHMAVLKYPTHLTWPEELINSDKFLYPELITEAGKREALRLRVERWQTFREHTGLFGGRTIFSRSGFESYVRGDVGPLLSPADRIRYLENILSMLSNKSYEIVFTDAEISTEIIIKSTKSAIMRGALASGSPFNKKIMCGPAYVYFDEPLPVVTFLLDFEREWDTVWKESPHRNRTDVINWLEGLLEDTRKQG